MPGGAKLSSFAKPGDVFKSDKPAKPFGAPESDAEEGDEDDEGSDEQSGAEEVESEEKEKEEPKAAMDDKKKPKLQKGTARLSTDCILVLTSSISLC